MTTLRRALLGSPSLQAGNGPARKDLTDEPPLRSELLSADQMALHGKALAASHTLRPGRPQERLLSRLAANERVLLGVRNLLTEAVKVERRITPAGEWLLDNFYLIEEQIRTAKRHLPKGYSRELPRLRKGPSAGLPRVYDLALEVISHNDGRVDPENLDNFVAAYQTTTTLQLGELWAIPIMLRLALIENLRRVAARIATHKADRHLAGQWADQITEVAAKTPKDMILAIADMARSKPPMDSSFVAEFTRRVQGQGPALALALTWIEQQLSESGQTIEQLVRLENQLQATDQVSMSNSIGSLRALGAMDWRTFVETLSVVEQTLREDPGDVYSQMDFAARDRYRHVVEQAARNSPEPENEVARQAIGLAREAAAKKGGDDREAHVGYYLIDKGVAQLNDRIRMRPSLAKLFGDTGRRYPGALYLGGIWLLTAVFTASLAATAYAGGVTGWPLGLSVLLALVCTSRLAVALVNWLVTVLATPSLLPRLDFSHGIPPELRTLVVVPTLLTSPPAIESLLEALEVRFLANRDAHLHFGLLTDLVDAATETLPQDAILVEQARRGIEALNVRYRETHGDAFFLFHRPRRFNPRDRVWMGYERKRGKLSDLNWLLRVGPEADPRERFALVVGATAILPSVRYVITLDTDTLLARDTARQFVATMAHPLNRARYDETLGRVVAGYGILQPRVAVSLAGIQSRYARLCVSERGIDPYTRAVSDVYQDLFGEGSFIGKGIYEVDVFERALGGRFPDNRILSHDLLEGCYARSGLISDVRLYEEYPSRYSEDASRRRRWIRGDWQIARWATPIIAGPDGSLHRNPLTILSRWKIFDNLRRSLEPAALTLLLALGWTLSPAPFLATMAVLGIILLPSLLATAVGILQKPAEMTLAQHLGLTMQATGRHLVQALFTVACLPFEAAYSLDAILRTLWRLLVTRRRLLEWNPSGSPNRRVVTSLAGSCRAMWTGPVLAAAVAATLWFLRPDVLAVAVPVAALWCISPVVAWWISRPLTRREARLTDGQTLFLRQIARKTWSFFETFVGADENWLPPDNFQEQPAPVIAHRTSPTNMGFSLLANLTAYDFGYITAGKCLDRTGHGLRAMDSLERYRGHFYNWYDTLSRTPLSPRYISSVDSGNLAGHLLTLGQGLRALADDPIVGPRLFVGIADTVRVLLDVARKTEPDLAEQLERLQPDLTAGPWPESLEATRALLERLAVVAAQTAAAIEAGNTSVGSPLRWWGQAFIEQCRDGLDELSLLAPWTSLLSSPHRPRDISGLDGLATVRQIAVLAQTYLPDLERRLAQEATPQLQTWFDALRPCLVKAGRRATERMALLETLAGQADALARMEYGFLFDKPRQLLSIGYNVSDHRQDASYYDLLASEARFSSFVAIAQGELPQESWFALGRLFTTTGGEPILLSWSGSMFEYLMPLLVMPMYENTLLDQTCRAAVASQIEYGKQVGTPWGISECGYNAIDVHQNYQYRAFGVPGLGLKRGLSEDLVIAPYATALALMVAPQQACANLEQLAAAGFEGPYGFYEAVDYTASRLPHGQTSAVVRSFMAHHQGMSLLSLSYQLLGRPMQQRFAAQPQFQATMLLLQERVPKTTAVLAHTTELAELGPGGGTDMPMRVFPSPDTPFPEVQLLSNGRYHVMLTNAGGGSSRWKDLAVTRWREDGACDNWGSFCYIQDVDNGSFWSTTYQPTRRRSKEFETIFSEGRAEFRCRHNDLDAYTEVVVSPEDDIEVRRITITNRSRRRRIIDVTSYAEVVLAPPAADALHPAFSNLFVQTEIIPEQRAILCTRRPRSLGEPSPCLLHLMAAHEATVGSISYETDRMRFIGRGNTVADPQAVSDAPGPLSDSQGSVLDPIVAIRYRITIEPEQSATINIVSGVGENRDVALDLVEKYQDRRLADRVFDLAWTHSQVLLRQINATQADAQLYCRIAGSILYANASLRAEPALLQNTQGQSGLWGYSISGDLPIVLLQIEDPANLDLVRQLVQAHAYWRLKGLAVDLVIWNMDHAGYRQLLTDQIMSLIAAGIEADLADRPGGIFVRSIDQIATEDRVLFQTVARAILTDSRGTLSDQADGRPMPGVGVLPLIPTRTNRSEPVPVAPLPRHDLTFYNGLGGFTPDGREYVITTASRQLTPAPWVNVLANPNFGTVISESGSAYTWSENAHEFRLTPWGNDPVSDGEGEAFYLRDEERGHYWSPTPLPCRGATPYVTRHGFGYSVFEHTERGIRSELWVYVAMDAAIKFSVLKVRNDSGRSRRISATGYAEWVLGDLRSKTAMHVVTDIDSETGALFARNPYNTEFRNRTAFFDVDETMRTVSGDRLEFLGRNGTLRAPAAMTRRHLSGRVGPALDPCGALQVAFDLAAGQEREIVFRLGVGRDADEARALVLRFRGSTAARNALDVAWQHWTHTLGAVHVETPDPALNVLANGWLLYQTLACRLWARSATYQSGGAFGFRDQLQDVMALIHARPHLVREHLLLCAAHQFEEGDVQHWWHPPVGRGVRTRCSDDYLWLPLAACRYVQATGDIGVLDEPVHFLLGRTLGEEEESSYDLPGRSELTASLYEHCTRAIANGLRFGAHGLPLMGSGDWNDGMNLVGEKGAGESVWLGFFLFEVLRQFEPLAAKRGDMAFAQRCQTHAGELRRNLDVHGWDGQWYRRAYFDDGTPLGSSNNPECRIDSIAQSWSVLSGGGDAGRSHQAMEALEALLVDREHGLIKLLTPPFDTSSLQPGYIKGYVPGVRENGGQYTHAAIWAAMAFAQMGDARRAWELFALINPINHGRSEAETALYKVEPYVVAADVYASAPHVGRGGWSWYTGSAAWMYRLIVESLLGVRLEGDRLRFELCLPQHWEGFTMHYRYLETVYHIVVMKADGESGPMRVIADGVEQTDKSVPLLDDHREHAVKIHIGCGSACGTPTSHLDA